MKKQLLSLTLATAILTIPTTTLAQDQTSTPPTDQLIITYEEQIPDQIENQYDITPIETTTPEETAIIQIDNPETLEQTIEQLEALPEITSVEPDYLNTHATTYKPNDPDFKKQWYHTTIQTPAAWTHTTGSQNIIVAVIDDGADTTHPDLAQQIYKPYDALTGKKSVPPGFHGTHVAGIIAATMDNNQGITGVAPKVKIMPVNVFDGDNAYTSDVVKGIRYATDNGADIINLSLGGYGQSAEFEKALQYAQSKGVIIIAAAGNEGVSNPFYPAAYPDVVGVAATTKADERASFSNVGSYVDISAPGDYIYSTYTGHSYGLMSGTSMATPVTSGVAALLLSADPSLTSKQAIDRLLSTSDDLGPAGKDKYYGYGRVNAMRAISESTLSIPTLAEVTDKSTAITGTAQTDTAVILTINKTAIPLTVTPQGTFSYKLPQKLTPGTTVKVYSERESMKSLETSLKVLDRTAPAKPVMKEVSDRSTSITGTAEAFSTVQITVGTRTYKTTATNNGTFTLAIDKQKAGTAIRALAIDKAQNRSAQTATTVTDRTAPAAPKVKTVTDKATTVTGTAEAGSTVTVTIGKKTYTAKATKNNNFTVKIPKQKGLTAFNVTATDPAKNKSKATNSKIKDTTPPAKPTITSSTATVIKGKGEPGSTVTVLSGKKSLAKTTVSKNGTFSITIKKQKAGSTLSVTAKDSSGNVSKVTTLKAKK